MLFLSSSCQILNVFPYAIGVVIISESEDDSKVRSTVLNSFMALIFLLFIGLIFQVISRWYLFNFSSSMVNQIRSKIYRVVINQPIEFFEKKENSSGNITHTLSSDVKAINTSSIDFYLLFFNGFSLTIFSIVICWFVYNLSSKVALIFLPFTWGALVLNYHIQRRNILGELAENINENTIISDAILNHSTLTSLSAENTFIQRYFGESENRRKNNWKNICFVLGISFLFGFVSFLICLVSIYILLQDLIPKI